MRLVIILTSGCLLLQIFNNGLVFGQETTSEQPTKGSKLMQKSELKEVEDGCYINPLRSITQNGHLYLCHLKNNNYAPCQFTNLLDDAKQAETVNSTTTDILKRDLFLGYNKFTHPLKDGNLSTVYIDYIVVHLDIDQRKGKITTQGYMRQIWYDDKFKWLTLEYENIKQLHLSENEIWRPDITLFNSATDRDDNMGYGVIIVNNTGCIEWTTQTVFTAFCSLDLRLWPFDTQRCRLKIGSWSMDIKYNPPFVENTEYAWRLSRDVNVYEWEVTSFKFNYEDDGFYKYIAIAYHMERQTSTYKALIFTPASCIILLVLSSFWLPPQMGEKLLLNGIVIVVIAVFLMYFAQLLPILAHNTPLVVLFYSSSLMLVSVSTIVSVTVLYLSSAKHRRRVPSCLRNLLNGPLGCVLCLAHLSSETDPQAPKHNELTDQNLEGIEGLDDRQMVASTTRSIQFDWIILATAIDRVFFFFYCIVFIILASAYSV